MTTVRLLPEAESDIVEILGGYESRSASVGVRFGTLLLERMTLLSAYPRIAAELFPTVRRLVLKPYPYGLFYRFEQDHDLVLVLAVLHLHREPDDIRQMLVREDETPIASASY